MNYYLDCEFDGFNGPLLSMGLIREDGLALYATLRLSAPIRDEWVLDNVVPIMYDLPSTIDYKLFDVKPLTLAMGIYNMLSLDSGLTNIVTDWPDDIAYFCKIIQTAPGKMIDIDHISFLMVRCDTYPTDYPGAIQHNAYWDAEVLRDSFKQSDNDNVSNG